MNPTKKTRDEISSLEALEKENLRLMEIIKDYNNTNANTVKLKERNAELESLYNDFKNFLDNTKLGALFLDRTLFIRRCTPQLFQTFKLNESILSKPLSEFIYDFSSTSIDTIINSVKKSLQEESTVETDVTHTNGNYYQMRLSPYKTKDGKVSGLTMSFIDITRLKKKEYDLKNKTYELSKAQEISKMGSWVLNVATNEVSWTEELYKMYNFDPSKPPPPYSEHMKLFTPESWALLNASLEKTSTKGIPYELELETVKKDGSNGWMWVMGEAVKDSEGNITHLRGIAQDITERKLVYEELKKEKQFNENINELSPACIYIHDIELDTTTYLNEQYTELMGYTLDDINNMTQAEKENLFHPEDRNPFFESLQNVYSGKSNSITEYRFRNKDGKYIWCYSIVSPFEINDENEVIKLIGVFIDISEKKKVEQALRVAKLKAESSNILKNQFLANMSHEIRTPMNSLTGFAHLLGEDDLDNEIRSKYIDYIQSSSKQLLNLIDDIIDVSKIESGELKLSYDNIRLSSLFRTISENFKEIQKAKEKTHIQIACKIPVEHDNIRVCTDSGRLKQVLSNLLDNALKFSHRGTIEFGYSLEANKIHIYVKDQGIGIPEEKSQFIFDRFGRIEYKEKKYEGTGLGLSICSGIVNLLGGTLAVESDLGVGSTFTFDIPHDNSLCTTEEDIEYKSSPNNINKQACILIAEDDKFNIAYFKAMFRKTDFKVLFAADGKQAVDLYKTTEGIDLILMDIRMPVMDGFEACKNILKYNPQAKIIAQTAFAMAGDKEKCLSLGFADYLSKPILKDVLFDKINYWLQQTD